MGIQIYIGSFNYILEYKKVEDDFSRIMSQSQQTNEILLSLISLFKNMGLEFIIILPFVCALLNMLVMGIKREFFFLSGLLQNLNFILDKHTKYNLNFSKSILNLLQMIITNSLNVFHEEFDLTLVSTLKLRQHYLEHVRKIVSKDIGLLLTRIDMQAILIELS